MFIKYIPRWRGIYQWVDASPVTNCQCKAVPRFLQGDTLWSHCAAVASGSIVWVVLCFQLSLCCSCCFCCQHCCFCLFLATSPKSWCCCSCSFNPPFLSSIFMKIYIYIFLWFTIHKDEDMIPGHIAQFFHLFHSHSSCSGSTTGLSFST